MATLEHTFARPAQRPGGGIASLLRAWIERSRMRRDLSRMDDRALRDIGVSREDLYREVEKPFWRP